MNDTAMNNPRHALDAGIDAARLADPLITLDDGQVHALVPSGYTLEDLTNQDLLRDHIIANVVVDDRDSLTGYAKRFSTGKSIIIADYDKGRIAAQLDWHGHNEAELAPQHVDHKVTHILRDSEEYTRWAAMEDQMHSQEDFALFIEENVADVVSPDHSVLLEVCRDLEASQGVSFKSGTRLDNGDRTFLYETQTNVTSNVSVPTEITLLIPLYNGEEPTEIRAKFRFKPTATGLLLGFRWHRVEYKRQASFREMAILTADDTGMPVFFGRT